MKIFASKNRATLNEVENSISENNALASATETAMDRDFIEEYKDDWCWVSNRDIPKEIGWFKIDREKQNLNKVSNDEALKIAWHERLFIYKSALIAAEEKNHLALYIGGEYDDGRLTALYLCGPDYLAWVAQK